MMLYPFCLVRYLGLNPNLNHSIFVLWSVLVRYLFGACSVLVRLEPNKLRISTDVYPLNKRINAKFDLCHSPIYTLVDFNCPTTHTDCSLTNIFENMVFVSI